MGGGILLCLVSRCGQPCLQAAENTLLPCITAAVGEATMSVFACVKESLQTATACKKCLASLACCVTDSCSFCECRSALATRSVKDAKDNLAALKRSRHRENFLFQLREPTPVPRPHLVSDPDRAAMALPTPVPLCLHGHPGVQGL